MGCEYYQNGFAGTECLKGLSYEKMIQCQTHGSGNKHGKTFFIKKI